MCTGVVLQRLSSLRSQCSKLPYSTKLRTGNLQLHHFQLPCTRTTKWGKHGPLSIGSVRDLTSKYLYVDRSKANTSIYSTTHLNGKKCYCVYCWRCELTSCAEPRIEHAFSTFRVGILWGFFFSLCRRSEIRATSSSQPRLMFFYFFLSWSTWSTSICLAQLTFLLTSDVINGRLWRSIPELADSKTRRFRYYKSLKVPDEATVANNTPRGLKSEAVSE